MSTKSLLSIGGVILITVLVVMVIFFDFGVSPKLSLSDASASTQPVHRFWSENYKHHFFTISEFEKDYVAANNKNWIYEGVVFDAFSSKQDNTKPVHRFWSAQYGGHFYSSNADEIADIRANDKSWQYEGIAYHVQEEGSSANPVYRFYAPAENAHFYTEIVQERDEMIESPQRWKYEGIAFYTTKERNGNASAPITDASTIVTSKNGVCGLSSGKTLASAPGSDLCVIGSPSSVSGTGPWTWVCAGAGEGLSAHCVAHKESVVVAQCSDGIDNDHDGYIDTDDYDCSSPTDTTESGTTAAINGVCGSDHSKTLGNKPVSSLCSTGNATVVSGSGPWKWSCAGISGGTSQQCSATKTVAAVNGSCGASDGQTISTKPTASLCSAGNTSTVSGSGPWSWECAGANGGTTKSCSASKTVVTTPVNGACGASDGQTVSTKPTANLCTDGNASTVAGNGPWSWSCAGTSGGTTDACNANKTVVASPVNGACGVSNGKPASSKPTSELCGAGTASAVAGSGPWNWSCAGTSGGTSATCSAPKASTSTSGVCGVDHGKTLSAPPQNPLCTVGSAAEQTGSGPWKWVCRGVDSGADVLCQAEKQGAAAVVNGQCGGANGSTVGAQPTSTAACSVGAYINTEDTASQWQWGCVGSGGGDFATCSATKS